MTAEELKSKTNIVDVIERRVQLKKQGSEFYGICPFHDDHKTSLQVNESKQIFKCFACDTGGDSIEFLTELGLTFFEAMEEINGGPIKNGLSTELKSAKKREPIPQWKYISNPPQETPNILHHQHGAPNKIWKYHNSTGKVVSYVCRFDLGDGEKIVLPYSFAELNGVQKWRFMGIPENRPLYNLHLILENPKATILVVEGEKTADAAQKQFDVSKTVVTTWIGGANGLKKTNFKQLNDRRIILFPDNDTAGELAMINVSQLIKTKVIRFVKNTDDKPKKWDCADSEWETDELKNYILNNLIDVPKPTEKTPEPIHTPEPIQAPKTIKSPKNPPLPPVKPIDKYFENNYFRFLGYDKDEKSALVYYFYSFEAKAVVKFSPSGMSSSMLLQIAPLMYWEQEFPGKSKMDTAAAQQFLVGNSHKLGIFKEKNIRGRGAWIDNDEFIIHTGERLLANNKIFKLNEYESNFCYEIGENLGFGNGKPLQDNESVKIIKALQLLNWERPANAFLLAGWCVIAPFCGVLDWRPHIWVTGPAGSGKSWTMEKVVKKLMGETGVIVQGKTTEAGVRGLLQSDARPVLFDESDVDDVKDAERIQSILALARAASYADGGGIVKGTQSGTARTYTIRSMFSFSSIGVQVQKQSDRSRFTILGFKPNDIQKKEQFKQIAVDWSNLITPEFVHSLQARTMEILPIILQNTKTFSDAATIAIGNQRTADQVGGMLAGAYSLQSKELISFEKAVEFVQTIDWTEEKGLEGTKDENQLFAIIMSHKLRVEGEFAAVERSVGELVLIASGFVRVLKISSENAFDVLKRNGIIVKDDRIFIANTAPEIKQMIRGTSWQNNHSKILERLDGAIKESPRQFTPGLNSRSVSLPIELIKDKEIQSEKYTSAENENLTAARTHDFKNITDDDIPF